MEHTKHKKINPESKI